MKSFYQLLAVENCGKYGNGENHDKDNCRDEISQEGYVLLISAETSNSRKLEASV
jgi:hypothetical protein